MEVTERNNRISELQQSLEDARFDYIIEITERANRISELQQSLENT